VLIDGDRLLIAHYTEGVHLLDVRNPERPLRLGSYDTFTDATCASFPSAAAGAPTSSLARTSSSRATSAAAST
jgi:hypothetical protein